MDTLRCIFYRRAVLGFAVLSIVSFTLASPPAHGQAAQPANSAAALPSAMTETECTGEQCVPDGKVSGTWTFSGILGTADWSNGAEAKVVIERFDEGGVEFRRIDLPTSTSYGLSAVYKGSLRGDRVEGTVVWSWNGHWNDEHPTGHWSAEIRRSGSALPPAEAINIPPSLIECEADQCAPGRTGGCRWTFQGREGESHCRQRGGGEARRPQV